MMMMMMMFLALAVETGGGAGSGGSLGTYQIEDTSLSYTDQGMSEEFDGSLGAFTAVGTSSGTVSLLATPSAPIYDLGTRSGTLLLQADEGGVAQIYQAFDISDGEELIVSMGTGFAQGAGGNNEYHIGISFTTANTGFGDGTEDRFYWDGGNEEISHWNGGTFPAVMAGVLVPGGALYWRLSRIGAVVVVSFSFDGRNWCPFSEVDVVARGHTSGYVWLFQSLANAVLTGSKIVAPLEVSWVRHQTASASPYPF